MLIQLDLESDEPIYVQLRNQIVQGIAKRELHPGEALPSVRSFAADLGINLHTVNKAYQQLKQEGFLLIHRQKGVVVNPDGVPRADEAYLNQLETVLKPLAAEAFCRGIGEADFARLLRGLYSQFEEKGDGF